MPDSSFIHVASAQPAALSFMSMPQLNRPLAVMLMLTLLLPATANARPSTQPPSVALRTALSHVLVADLATIEVQPDKTTATFIPVRTLHNTEYAAEIGLPVPPQVMPMLEPGQRYIIAYQKQRRVGRDNPPRYEPFPDGPVLLTEQGANPAVFPYHEQLESSLSADPAAAVDDPAQLIEHIQTGLALPELALKRFYLRELFNWTALHDDLSAEDMDRLRAVLTAPWLDSEMLVAFYEPRPALQRNLGLQMLQERARDTLSGSPVQLDLFSAQPSLLLGMLRFLASDEADLPEQHILARWLYSNHHPVAENALLLIAAENTDAAVALARQALQSKALVPQVRRALTQFMRNH